MTYIEEKDSDEMENLSDIGQYGAGYGDIKLLSKFIKEIEDESENKIIYPSQMDLIKMGYDPQIKILSSDKPYLYPGEQFRIKTLLYNCFAELAEIKEKRRALRVATFNVHNMITRCNSGISPMYGTTLNPFEKPRDLNRFFKVFKYINADVLCLQELVPLTEKDIDKDITDYDYIRKNFNWSFLNKKMEELGYKYKVIGNTQFGNFLSDSNRSYFYLANAIYSKNEIIDHKIYAWTFLNRSSVFITIKYQGKPVNIGCVHWEYYLTKSPILEKISKSKNPLITQATLFYDLLETMDINNTILCGDFNINLFNKGQGPRYIGWDEKTKKYRNNWKNTNFSKIITNWSENDQTDFIIITKKSKLKAVYSNVVRTTVSDHNAVLTDFIWL
jgi:endonuclease/exonuclease/phosphatase family metal-dependent hydrolase